MFSNLFSASPAVWAGLIAAAILLPILIHLINLMRHRRVKWAAMEFLLQSYKKRRNRVWLKQFLLLLARITAMLLTLLMLAQIGCDNRPLSSLVGTRVTHHYILLDDSFSMEDRVAESSVFDRARTSLSALATRIEGQQNQRFTLLRFSRAAAQAETPPEGGENQISQLADLNGEIVDSNFAQRIQEVQGRLNQSSLAIGPGPALEVVQQLIERRDDESPVVTVLSDFRKKDWESDPEIKRVMESLHGLGARLEMIRCAQAERDNLAIADIRIEGNLRVAGFPLMMSVTVRNFGETRAEKVQVKIDSLEFPPVASTNEGNDVPPDVSELPTVFVDKIEAGATETRSFPVYFNLPGKHVVHARIISDTVASDNARFKVVEVFDSAKVLLVDGPERKQTQFLETSLEPNGLTGIQPVQQTAEFLRDAETNALREFDVIVLADIGQLAETAVKNLESYVAGGGGLAIFVGPNTNRDFYNQRLFSNGSGLLPFPLADAFEIGERLDDQVPNIGIGAHPIVKPFSGLKNSPLGLVQLFKVLRPPREWSASDDPSVEIVATVRGDERTPLLATRQYAAGRVALIATTAAPVWNNWSRNESYPLFMLMLEDWLAAGKFRESIALVGTDLQITFSADGFRRPVRYTGPSSDPRTRQEYERDAAPGPDDDRQYRSTFVGNPENETVGTTRLPGWYEAWLTIKSGGRDVRRWALNVDTAESDLTLSSSNRLAAIYGDAEVRVLNWNELSPQLRQSNTSNIAKLILVILLLILIVEQWLAYSASYHPSRRAERRLAG